MKRIIVLFCVFAFSHLISKAQKVELKESFIQNERTLTSQYMEHMLDQNKEAEIAIVKGIAEIRESKREKKTLPYILQNSNSPIALTLLMGYAGYDIPADKIESIF